MTASIYNEKIDAPEFPNGSDHENKSLPVVLVVDDDEDSRLMIRTLLEMWKFPVIEAADDNEAISISENMCPNLILMDVKMPNLDGFKVTEKNRQTSKIKNVPIVLLSGCAETSYKQKAAAVGGNEYMTKPLDFEKLETILGRYVSRSPEISG